MRFGVGELQLQLNYGGFKFEEGKALGLLGQFVSPYVAGVVLSYSDVRLLFHFLNFKFFSLGRNGPDPQGMLSCSTCYLGLLPPAKAHVSDDRTAGRRSHIRKATNTMICSLL